jgi:hypothetical protein
MSSDPQLELQYVTTTGITETVSRQGYPPFSESLNGLVATTAALATASKSLADLFDISNPNNKFTNQRYDFFRRALLFGDDFLPHSVILASDFNHISCTAREVSIVHSQQLVYDLISDCEKIEDRAVKMSCKCTSFSDEVATVKADIEALARSVKGDRSCSILAWLFGTADDDMKDDCGILQSSFSDFEKLTSNMGDFIQSIRSIAWWFVNNGEGLVCSAANSGSQVGDFHYFEVLGSEGRAIIEECTRLRSCYKDFIKVLMNIKSQLDSGKDNVPE